SLHMSPPSPLTFAPSRTVSLQTSSFLATSPTGIGALTLRDALPILPRRLPLRLRHRRDLRRPALHAPALRGGRVHVGQGAGDHRSEEHTSEPSHVSISYAVFCLKKKTHRIYLYHTLPAVSRPVQQPR